MPNKNVTDSVIIRVLESKNSACEKKIRDLEEQLENKEKAIQAFKVWQKECKRIIAIGTLEDIIKFISKSVEDRKDTVTTLLDEYAKAVSLNKDCKKKTLKLVYALIAVNCKEEALLNSLREAANREKIK